ncbi:MAG: DNA-binding protein [Planctomycetota bacterium]|nr:MAG: DNA-binding protein [Planctomycetota bacterium]
MAADKEARPSADANRNEGARSSDSESRVHGIRRLLKPKEAARALGICERKLWELGNCGAVPTVRIGRAVRYDPSDLEASIEEWKRRGAIG